MTIVTYKLLASGIAYRGTTLAWVWNKAPSGYLWMFWCETHPEMDKFPDSWSTGEVTRTSDRFDDTLYHPYSQYTGRRIRVDVKLDGGPDPLTLVEYRVLMSTIEP